MRKLRRVRGSRFYPAFFSGKMREPSNLITRARVARALETEQTNQLTVCFTGHRYLSASDLPIITLRLDAALELCYQQGYRDFLCGGALGFDMLAAERVLALQCQHTGVRLIFVIPCGDQVQLWSASQAQRYERLLYAANEIRVLSPFYFEGCMQVRNRHMVDHSDLCICYFRHAKGGTASTVAYAIREQVPVLNVAMDNADVPLPTR